MNYDKVSHSHCWESKNPPCGLKGKHRCCLCGEPVPEEIAPVYICNKEFPNLGLEVGDYFPANIFTEEAIEDALKKGKIIIEK